MRPLLEQVILVIRCRADRGLTATPTVPWQASEPGRDVLRRERLSGFGITGIGERVAPGPGRLLQIERAAMPDAAAVGVREAAAIDELSGEARRIKAAERHLRVRPVG
jgi:hypothetical protein